MDWHITTSRWETVALAATVVAYLCAAFIIPRILLEKRNPSAVVAWMMALVLIPTVGVPAYILIGERRVRRIMREKAWHPTDHGSGRSGKRLATIPEGLAGVSSRVLTSAGAFPPSSGNRVRFVEDGRDAYETVIGMVNGARHHVHAQFYVLSRDVVGRRFLQALSVAAGRGVKVRLLLDGAGSWGEMSSAVRRLKSFGGEVSVFLPMFPVRKQWSTHLRNHRKVLLVDGRKAFTGGMNIGKVYMGVRSSEKRWRDIGVVLEGDAVRDLQNAFLDDWEFSGGSPVPGGDGLFPEEGSNPPGDSLVQIAMSGPDRPSRPIYHGLFSLIAQARRRVWIQTPYFVPDDAISAALSSAALRGVDVRLMVPDVSVSNFWPVAMAGRGYCRDVQRYGVEVMAYTPTHLHSKLLIADDDVVVVGSPNMDVRSFFLNFESGIFLYGRKEVQTAERIFLADRSNTAQIPVDRSISTRLLEGACRLFSPIF